MNDIKLKVKWINDENINKYLHYTLPLNEDKTFEWYEKNKENKNRIDQVIEVFDNNKYYPVGLIGLLNIDTINKKAEFYICLGEKSAHGKGIATKASCEFIKKYLDKIDLNKIYLYTEKDNILAQKLFENIGFKKEGLLLEDLIYSGRKVDRYVYGLLREDFSYND
nr:GNAT family protein [Paeniclostridium sordellii]